MRQQPFRVAVLVLAVAVCGFTKQHVSVRGRRGRLFKNRLSVPPNVAGKHHYNLLSAFADGEFQARRAKNVPRVKRLHMKFRADVEAAAARHRLQLFQHRIHVLRRVKRSCFLVVLVFLAFGVLRLFFLQVRGVLQQQLRQLNRCRIGKNRPAIAVARQHGQPARMVQVCVRQYRVVNRLRIPWQRLKIPLFQLVGSLKESAIHQQLLARSIH